MKQPTVFNKHFNGTVPMYSEATRYRYIIFILVKKLPPVVLCSYLFSISLIIRMYVVYYVQNDILMFVPVNDCKRNVGTKVSSPVVWDCQ